MGKSKYCLLTLLLLLSFYSGGHGSLAFAEAPKYVPGEILVKFKPTLSSRAKTDVRNQLSSSLIEDFKRISVQHIKIKDGQAVEEAIANFRSFSNVEYAEPNYIMSTRGTTPNDTNFSKQWGLNNTGQTVNGTTGTPDADIDAPEAWDVTTGSSSVIVAVIDSGVDYNHPDLSANIWRHIGETAGNGIDDDGNGFTDDTRGWDFVDSDNDPMDVVGHGTHVAGIIGAVGNNSTGVTGVA